VPLYHRRFHHPVQKSGGGFHAEKIDVISKSLN
jgi:hypothetical protein